MHNFRELNVWKKSMEFATKFYQISNEYPKSELYGLTSQSRRACYSISSNIAEGAGRSSNEQFSYFLNIAVGSSFELECQIQIASNLDFISSEITEELIAELRFIQNMLIKLKNSLT